MACEKMMARMNINKQEKFYDVYMIKKRTNGKIFIGKTKEILSSDDQCSFNPISNMYRKFSTETYTKYPKLRYEMYKCNVGLFSFTMIAEGVTKKEAQEWMEKSDKVFGDDSMNDKKESAPQKKRPRGDIFDKELDLLGL